MCGIAGIIGHIVEPNRAALKRMSNALLHRGPDGDGYWEASPDERGWGAMLAFRRLSILDLSPTAMQPMVDPVTGDVVVINGEIYNYVALRDRLAATGHTFQSSGDAGAPSSARLARTRGFSRGRCDRSSAGYLRVAWYRRLGRPLPSMGRYRAPLWQIRRQLVPHAYEAKHSALGPSGYAQKG